MAGRFDLDTTTLATLLDDPEARAVLDEVVPELAAHPMLPFVKGMPVSQLLQLAGAQIPADTVETLKARIGAL
jgi:beta-glucosidase